MHNVVKVGNVIVSNPEISTGAKALCFYFLFNPDSNWMEATQGLGINKETFFKYVRELSDYGYLRIEHYDQKGAVGDTWGRFRCAKGTPEPSPCVHVSMCLWRAGQGLCKKPVISELSV